MPRKEMIGVGFNRVVCLRYSHKNSLSELYYEFQCYCGKKFITKGSRVRLGYTKSCGCGRILGRTKYSGGERMSSEYVCWQNMKSRCYKKDDINYKNYGGRGIKVCGRWRYSYSNFLKDMGRKPSPKHTLDRYPNINGNYTPDNCRWATRHQQDRGKRGNIWLEAYGVKMILADWAKEWDTKPDYIKHHLKKGKSFEWIFNRFSKTPILKN
jgi:hypothetical protein